jgi:hypothetical protein
MDFATARDISALMLDISARLDASVRTLRDHADAEEYDAYRLAVGTLMGGIYCEILTPIYSQYPALRPEALKNS